MLKPELPSIDGREGDQLPFGLPAVADAHVHAFPSHLFSTVWQWFDENAWPIRCRMTTRQIFDFLLGHGLRHIVALQYAHKPGIAAQLNRYKADECCGYRGKVTGMATVFSGEANAAQMLRQAFDLGLGGVELHAPVQCFEMDADYMAPIYATDLRAYRLDRIMYGSDLQHSLCLGSRTQIHQSDEARRDGA